LPYITGIIRNQTGESDEYLALKSEKEELLTAGRYQGETRQNFARKMGSLLSYPETYIGKILTED